MFLVIIRNVSLGKGHDVRKLFEEMYQKNHTPVSRKDQLSKVCWCGKCEEKSAFFGRACLLEHVLQVGLEGKRMSD